MPPRPTWFVFDLGNTLIRLAYDRVIAAIALDAAVPGQKIVETLEEPGFYRDLERGLHSFEDFHGALKEGIGYRGSVKRLREVWTDFFDGPVEGMEELLARIRKRYKVGFLSNSNEVHAGVIPSMFPTLFRPEDLFVYSYKVRSAKPDAEIFHEAARVFDVALEEMILVDDLPQNVAAARNLGLRSFQFVDAERLERELREEGIL
ncbi:MAG TPA: HAD family phosphatase [Thermoanaerobaculia bacterium]|nr:HAD family phosphatase [Thermoanaerobaculia bacterium]